MRVIVCGGRGEKDRVFVFWVLDDLNRRFGPFSEVVCGVDPYFKRGVDGLAWDWAGERGIPRKAFPADWKRLGRAAGPIRNGEMARYGAERCIAFPGGDGTDNMMEQARGAGIRVIEVAPKKRARGENGEVVELGRWVGPLSHDPGVDAKGARSRG